MSEPGKYRAADIAAWLTSRHETGPDAALRCGRVVAEAWNNREFYASATGLPVTAFLRATGMRRPGMRVDDVLDALARRFGVHLHDCPAWERDVFWRKETDRCTTPNGGRSSTSR
ncbi:hypothetical protein [Amycolatopsis sp. NPDC102389]|uniref:hypothetical protein n=1 Tax=Amycolatopsis sp. NPDC102389 TaxID=3363941 RepID=UPI003808A0B5